MKTIRRAFRPAPDREKEDTVDSYIEYANKCGKCKETVKSRLFYRKIEGAWVYLCITCWNVEAKEDDR